MFYQFQHFGVSEYFCKEYGEDFNYPMHLHRAFECICVTEGRMDVTVDGRVYSLGAGESVLVFPNQLHALSCEKSKHMLCIFSGELVRAYTTKVQEKIPESNRLYMDAFLFVALDKLLPESTAIEKKGVLYSICAAFDEAAAYTQHTSFEAGLLQKIFTFVEEHFAAECTLEALAREMGYSYSYLSRCFKKSTGLSFNTYVNQYRISNACYLLRNTDSSVLQCALESGYTSLRSFNRNFLSFLSVTPREYREQVKNCSLKK